jgi:hypothetical protein
VRRRGLTGISSPVYADDRDVLKQDQIRRDLLDRPRCEAYDDDPSFPFDAFQAGYDQALRSSEKAVDHSASLIETGMGVETEILAELTTGS